MFSVSLPEKEPYEGKATQKQKQRIWELGYRDQSVIDTLGKKQAGILIDQLYGFYRGVHGLRTGRKLMGFGAFCILASVISIFLPRVMPAARDSDFVAAIAVFGFFGGILFLLIGSVKVLSVKTRK